MRICGTYTHHGTYGSQYIVDIYGRPLEKRIEVKRRKAAGRPKKNEISEGRMFVVSDTLYTWALKRFFLSPER